MSISSQLVQTKINSGGLQQFGASMSTLFPQLSPCGTHLGVDQYGRPSPPNSVDSLGCPGLFNPSVTIENENSLRSFLSPRYYDLPVGLSGGNDTLFGRNGGRAYISGYAPNKMYDINDFTGGNKNIQDYSPTKFMRENSPENDDFALKVRDLKTNGYPEFAFGTVGQQYGNTNSLLRNDYKF